MSTARKEEIIKKGFIKSLLEGTLELKDLAGINIDLDMARQAYIQGLQETTQNLIELVKSGMATAAKQDTIIDGIGKMYLLTASDAIQLEDNTSHSSGSQTWAKAMQFTILSSGTVRVKAQIKATSPADCWAQVRVNDVDRRPMGDSRRDLSRCRDGSRSRYRRFCSDMV